MSFISSFSQSITLNEKANFGGYFKTINVGEPKLFDFNDITSSIKVPHSLGTFIFENASNARGNRFHQYLSEGWATKTQLLTNVVSVVSPSYHLSGGGDTTCNPNHCLDLVERLEALNEGARSNYYPSSPSSPYYPSQEEIKPVLDSVIKAYEHSPQGHQARVAYNKAMAAYEVKHNRWLHLPPNKQHQQEEPKEPEYPLSGNKLEQLRYIAITVLTAKKNVDEIKPVLDSVIKAYEQSPQGHQARVAYNKAMAAYKLADAHWLHLPPNKRDQQPEPKEPEDPLSGNKLEQLRYIAITVLIEKNHVLEIQTTQQELNNCKCAAIGYGTPTPAFPNSASVANDIRTNLPAFTANDLYNVAKNDQMGIIGSDYRTKEDIGSASFEREFSGGPLNVGDLINFVWRK